MTLSPDDPIPGVHPPPLLTRLAPPAAPADAVLRPRLQTLLDGVWANRLTLITAPAGYGKSVLLRQWLDAARTAGRSCAYIALSSAESEPAALINYLAAALAGIAPELGGTTGELLDVQPRPDIPTLLNPLINDIVRFNESLALVLDDVHTVADHPSADAIRYLLNHGSENLHILLAGRTTADFRDVTLLLDEGGHHLSAESLNFTADEIERLFAAHPDCGLGSDDLVEVARRTDGWPAGLRLVLLACRDGQDGWRTMLADNRVLKGLLFKQIFQRLDRETRWLLAAAALPEKFTVSLVAEMTGSEPEIVAEKLGAAVAAGLFISPVGAAGQWWRFHTLFREFLLGEHAARSPEIEADDHRRAGAWFARRRQYSEAVEHFVQAGRFEAIREIILVQGEVLTMRGEAAHLQKWCEQIPAEIRSADPVVGVWYAWSLVLNGALDAAVREVERFEQAAARMGAEEGWSEPRRLNYEGLSAAVRSTAALQTGDLAEAGRLALEASQKLSPSDVVTRNLMDQQLSAVYLRTGDTHAARDLLPNVVASSRQTGRPRLLITALQRLAYLHVLQGRLHDADRVYRQLIEYAASESLTVISAPARLYYASNILREWDRLEEADALAAGALADCRRADIGSWIVEGLMILGRIRAESGDVSGAAACFREAEQVAVREASPQLDAYLQSWQVREAIRSGDLQAVRRWIRACGLDVEDDLRFDLEKEHLIYCAALIAVGEPEAARQMLSRIERAARKAARWYRVIEALLLQAQALDALGDRGRGREPVDQAVRLAEPHDFRRIFLNAGPAVLRILAELGEKDSEVGTYARRIVGAEARAATPARPPGDVPGLTGREREILALLAAGLGNAEIAARLQLGLNTVRWHNRNIYSKLGAGNRTQAAALARDWGLLD